MYIKAKTYSINWYREPIAYVILKVNIFGYRLKAETTLKNGASFITKSGMKEEQEKFEERVQRIVLVSLNLIEK